MTSLRMVAFALLPFVAAPNAWADAPLMVNPQVNARPGAPGGDNVNSARNLSIRLRTSCFGQNLRVSTNPISPQSLVTGTMTVEIRATPGSAPIVKTLWVKFPGDIVTKKGLTQPEPEVPSRENFGGKHADGSEIADLTMAMYGNTLQLELPPEQANLNLDANGNVIPVHVTVGKPTFEQKVMNCGDMTKVYGKAGYSSYTPTYACGSYMAKDGKLSSELKSVSVSQNGASVELHVAFPGQTGYCGSYWSPLMLFFDEARPRFIGASGFQLSSAGQTYWVEPGAPGHFLVLDRNGNGKVDDKGELFGDQDSDGNGFHALKELDSNKDGNISAKDRKFKKLMLWNDKNGDGLTQEGELVTATSMGVTNISLKYQRNQKSYGETAEARQVSDFSFKQDGKTHKGVVEDIWFGAVPGSAGKK